MAVKIDGTLGIDKIKDGSVTSSDLIDSINLPGSPTAATAAPGTKNNQLATTAYVDGKMVLGTAVNASGAAIDFTGIPSWVKRITVMFAGVSTNGSSTPIVQIGCSANGIETSGYTGAYYVGGADTHQGSFNSYFQLTDAVSASHAISGILFLSLANTNNTWVESSTLGDDGAYIKLSGGVKKLGGSLDRVRITTANGTDAFDAGSVNIMYEG
jgi:hypothetical protein